LKNNKLHIALILFLFFSFSSCVTKRIGGENKIPPNVHTFYFSKRIVWKNLIQIIRNELLMPFQYASYKKSHFVCREVAEADNPQVKAKVQLSGFLTFDGEGTVVTLYKQAVIWNENQQAWKATATDYTLETMILRRLDQKLARYRKK